jgi:hypothetical protein
MFGFTSSMLLEKLRNEEIHNFNRERPKFRYPAAAQIQVSSRSPNSGIQPQPKFRYPVAAQIRYPVAAQIRYPVAVQIRYPVAAQIQVSSQ